MVKLNRIYTRTGDNGTTGLGDGARVAKFTPRVEAFGTVDEANAAVGLARLHTAEDAEMDAILEAAGYKQPTRAARIDALSKSPSQMYPNTDEGFAICIAIFLGTDTSITTARQADFQGLSGAAATGFANNLASFHGIKSHREIFRC